MASDGKDKKASGTGKDAGTKTSKDETSDGTAGEEYIPVINVEALKTHLSS